MALQIVCKQQTYIRKMVFLLCIYWLLSHPIYTGHVWDDCFFSSSWNRRQSYVKDESGKELPQQGHLQIQGRVFMFLNTTTQEPNKPSKRTYLSNHTITPSNKHPDWEISECFVCANVCVYVHVCVFVWSNNLISAAVFIQRYNIPHIHRAHMQLEITHSFIFGKK